MAHDEHLPTKLTTAKNNRRKKVGNFLPVYPGEAYDWPACHSCTRPVPDKRCGPCRRLYQDGTGLLRNNQHLITMDANNAFLGAQSLPGYPMVQYLTPNFITVSP